MAKQREIKEIDFYGQILPTIKYSKQVWVSVRHVCEGMGLNWKGQHEKLTGDPDKFNCVDIHTVGSDGKQREMLCISIKSLPTWLLSINTNKVKPELRDNVKRYQAECVQALHDYWFEGVAINPRALNPEWQEQRANGKIIRGTETDVIQQFVNYAKKQGSKNADHYYANITRMTYKGLDLIVQFNSECTDLREFLEAEDLFLLGMAEIYVARSLRRSMEEGAFYKFAYVEAKNEVLRFKAFDMETKRAAKPQLKLVPK